MDDETDTTAVTIDSDTSIDDEIDTRRDINDDTDSHHNLYLPVPQQLYRHGFNPQRVDLIQAILVNKLVINPLSIYSGTWKAYVAVAPRDTSGNLRNA